MPNSVMRTMPMSTPEKAEAENGSGATAAAAAALAAAAPVHSTPASQLLSPTRVSLVTSVFHEFSRAWELRQRAAAAASGHSVPSAAAAGCMPLSDAGKALRKVGLRSGDLRTAKMNDEAVYAQIQLLRTPQGGSGADADAADSLSGELFRELVAATLFQQ